MGGEARGWEGRKRQPTNQHSFLGPEKHRLEDVLPRGHTRGGNPPPLADSDICGSHLGQRAQQVQGHRLRKMSGDEQIACLPHVNLDFSTSCWQGSPHGFLICLQIRDFRATAREGTASRAADARRHRCSMTFTVTRLEHWGRTGTPNPKHPLLGPFVPFPCSRLVTLLLCFSKEPRPWFPTRSPQPLLMKPKCQGNSFSTPRREDGVKADTAFKPLKAQSLRRHEAAGGNQEGRASVPWGAAAWTPRRTSRGM